MRTLAGRLRGVREIGGTTTLPGHRPVTLPKARLLIEPSSDHSLTPPGRPGDGQTTGMNRPDDILLRRFQANRAHYRTAPALEDDWIDIHADDRSKVETP